MRIDIFDASGEEIWADNVGSPPDDVIIRGEGFELDAQPVDDLSEWRSPSTPGTLTIQPRLGEALAVNLVGPESVSSVDLKMFLHHVKGATSIIESGASQRVGELLAQSQGPIKSFQPVIRGIQTERGELCPEIPNDWIIVSSLTPAVCEVVEAHEAGSTWQGDAWLAQTVRFREDGRCELEFEAPSFPARAGFPRVWTASIFDTSEFF